MAVNLGVPPTETPIVDEINGMMPIFPFMANRFSTTFINFCKIALLLILPVCWSMASHAFADGLDVYVSPPGSQMAGSLSVYQSDRQEALAKELEWLNDSGVIVGQRFQTKPYEVYRAYLRQTEPMIKELVDLQKKLDQENRTVSLQLLSAMVQRVSIENTALKQVVLPQNRLLGSFLEIQLVVTSLEDAVQYWQAANRHRRFSRRNLLFRVEEDTVLRIKVKTALNAIESLAQTQNDLKAVSLELRKDH